MPLGQILGPLALYKPPISLHVIKKIAICCSSSSSKHTKYGDN